MAEQKQVTVYSPMGEKIVFELGKVSKNDSFGMVTSYDITGVDSGHLRVNFEKGSLDFYRIPFAITTLEVV